MTFASGSQQVHRAAASGGRVGRAVGLCAAVLVTALWPVGVSGQHEAVHTLATAQYQYYDGHYLEAAAQAGALLEANPDDLAALELRTAALLFQVKRLIGEPDDRGRAVEDCEPCPTLVADFRQDFDRGRALAKARLDDDPDDREAQFFLGKLDLNYIWLHLGPLGKRTGWSEYREARHTLDALLEVDPSHVRARVARAWIDYIVDTRVSWMFRWILGGGDRTGALVRVREAVDTPADFYPRVEARFALWEMLSREGRIAEAVEVARGLVADFPDNDGLLEFLADHAEEGRSVTP